MPFETIWRTWTLITFYEVNYANLRGKEFMNTPLAIQHQKLKEGLCFGWSTHWLRSHIDRPNELWLERLTHLAKRLGSAVAIQFIHSESRAALERKKPNVE
ncbi:MAG: YopT-type cysteine protease domain-containing protein [Hyphomicrobiaceae bacterium]